MNKKLLALLIGFMMAVTSVPTFAADSLGQAKSIRLEQSIQMDEREVGERNDPVIFQKTITVTDEGGKYEVGFVTLFFKKDFLVAERLPATFEVKVCVKDGVPGVEINPSTTGFLKDVIIKVDGYKGLLYDEDSGKNVRVQVKTQVIKAEHFSWFRFR